MKKKVLTLGYGMLAGVLGPAQFSGGIAGGAPPPVPSYHILTEESFSILTEEGFYILTEEAP